MKHAFEDLHLDALVVASAASLALRYLRRPQSTSAKEKTPPDDGNSLPEPCHRKNGVADSNSASAASAASSFAAHSSQGNRTAVNVVDGGSRGERGVTVKQLAVTTLHLASKYHQVYEEEVVNFGVRLSPDRVYKLGEEGGYYYSQPFPPKCCQYASDWE